MIKLLVDFINSTFKVQDLRLYQGEDLNKLFKRILSEMKEVKCNVVRIHLNRDGRWHIVGNYTALHLEEMIDDDMCG